MQSKVLDDGFWQGDSHWEHYHLNPPTQSNTVDADLTQRYWCLSIRVPDDEYHYFAPLPTFEDAKSLCLRHAVTGDLAEVRAIDQIAKAEAQLVDQMERAARKQQFPGTDPPRIYPILKWHPNTNAERDALVFRPPGTRGAYWVRFDPTHRWVVQFMQYAQVTAEHCFVTAEIARTACWMHSDLGEWRGMMQAPWSPLVYF